MRLEGLDWDVDVDRVVAPDGQLHKFSWVLLPGGGKDRVKGLKELI